MTHTQTTYINRIALRAGKQGACPAEVGALASVFEKSATELKHKKKLLKCKQTIQIATFNVRTLNRIGQLPELISSAVEHKIDIICIQEHRYTHTEDIKYHQIGNEWILATVSAWKNSVNATVGGVGMLIGPKAIKTVNSIERIQPRMMTATFNGNPRATIISCYSPTNISEETKLATFYDELSSLVRSIPKHKLLIQLSLRKNATRTATTKHYDWALLNNKDIRDIYVLELRNRFETLQEKEEKNTSNDEYENFVNAHLEVASKCIPTKPGTKYRAPWEIEEVREKRALEKTASGSYRKNPRIANARKLIKAQKQLAGIYLKGQTEFIQNKIDKIRDSVEDRQSRIAWQTINEVSGRKSTAKAKLKAANQQERIKLWKQHFENLLANPPNVTQEPITRIISKQLDIKLGPFTKEESTRFLEKLKKEKLQGLTRFPQKCGRRDNSTTYCSDTATQSITKIR